MREGFDRLKSKNWFKLDRFLIDYAVNTLEDPEFKLWIALRGSAHDFEGESLGHIRVTLTLIKNRFHWSQGKSSSRLSGLIKKGFVRRLKRGHYFIVQKLEDVQNLEHITVQKNEHEVRSSELIVPKNELSSLTSQSSKDKESLRKPNSDGLSNNELEKIWEDICKEDLEKGLNKGF